VGTASRQGVIPLFRDHPPGLAICFATEMWERFSYYGMRALLIFYLTQHFLFSDQQSYAIYGAYTALVWMTPVFGGMVADRWLGARKAVTAGGVLLVMGHLGLAFEGPQAVLEGEALATVSRSELHVQTFYLSLALIIVGVGLLKTNVTTLVGSLYEEDDPRRDSGFTIFYWGINLGGMIAPLLCGWIGMQYGWRYGFGLAGIGMVAGLLVFLKGQRHFKGAAEPRRPDLLNKRVIAGIRGEHLIYAGTGAAVALLWLLIQLQELVGGLLALIGGSVAAFVIYYSIARCTREERARLIVCAILIVFTIGFWAFVEQVGSSVALYSERLVDREVAGVSIPAAALQSLLPFFVILLAPLFSILWLRLGRAGREPNTAIKFVLALVQVSLGFLVLSYATATSDGGLVPLAWFALAFLLFATGEICLAPIGQAMITRLAPQRVVGLMMGSFFLALSIASYVAALLARTVAAPAPDVPLHETYSAAFGQFGLMAGGVALLLLLLSPLLSRTLRARPAGAVNSISARRF
jgi:proton-dependent oligopeptide transporter, POT family